jgi:nucleoside-diphosphate-sugar epimerase
VSSLLPSRTVDLTGRSIFVTGGTGFLGKTLLDYLHECALAADGAFRVTVLSRSPERFLARWPEYRDLDWLTFRRGDLQNFPAPEADVTDFVHGAADTHDVVDKMAWIDQIVTGTSNALRWALAAGARRFLLISSGAVYGSQPTTVPRLREDYGGAPPTTSLLSVYGQAKRMAEQVCTVFGATNALDTVIARCFAIAGPHVPFDGPYAIGNFIRDALSGNVIRVRGDGLTVRSYLFGRDVAHWLTTLLVRGKAGEAYNVGSDNPLTVADLARTVASILAPQARVLFENASGSDQGRSIYVPDIAKAQRLGLAVETGLRDSIRLSAARNATGGRPRE